MAKIRQVTPQLNYQMGNMPNLEAGGSQSILAGANAVGQGVNALASGLAKVGTSIAHINLYKKEEQRRKEIGDEKYSSEKWLRNNAHKIALKSATQAAVAFDSLKDNKEILESETPDIAYMQAVQDLQTEALSVFDDPNLQADDPRLSEAAEYIRPENFKMTGNVAVDRARKAQQFAGAKEYYNQLYSTLGSATYRNRILKKASEIQAKKDFESVSTSIRELVSQVNSIPSPDTMEPVTKSFGDMSPEAKDFVNEGLKSLEKNIPIFASRQLTSQVLNGLKDEITPEDTSDVQALSAALEGVNGEEHLSLNNSKQWEDALRGGMTPELFATKGLIVDTTGLEERIKASRLKTLADWSTSKRAISGKQEMLALYNENKNFRAVVDKTFKDYPDLLRGFLGTKPSERQLTQTEQAQLTFRNLSKGFFKAYNHNIDVSGDYEAGQFLSAIQSMAKSDDPNQKALVASYVKFLQEQIKYADEGTLKKYFETKIDSIQIKISL